MNNEAPREARHFSFFIFNCLLITPPPELFEYQSVMAFNTLKALSCKGCSRSNLLYTVTLPSGGYGYATRLSGSLPRLSGSLPRPSGSLPRPSGSLPRPSGSLPKPSGNSQDFREASQDFREASQNLRETSQNLREASQDLRTVIQNHHIIHQFKKGAKNDC
jgi:hypothetical protein